MEVVGFHFLDGSDGDNRIIHFAALFNLKRSANDASNGFFLGGDPNKYGDILNIAIDISTGTIKWIDP